MSRFRVVAPLDVFWGLYNQHTNLYQLLSIYPEQYTNKLIPCDVQSLIIEFLLLLMGFGRSVPSQTGLTLSIYVGNFFDHSSASDEKLQYKDILSILVEFFFSFLNYEMMKG